MKKILIVTRYDSDSKAGGDLNLMKSFKEVLDEEFYCEMHTGCPSSTRIREFDIVLALNFDRPAEAYSCLKKAKKCGVKFVFYSLHHPDDGVINYLKYGVKGWRKLIAFLAAYNPKRYEFILWFIKVFKNVHLKLPFSSVRKAQVELMTKSDLVLFVNERERVEVEKSLNIKMENYRYVPHIIPAVEVKSQSVKNRVIVPGRLESRKNQSIVFDIIKDFKDCEFIFVGGVSENDKIYAENVISLINHYSNSKYISEMKLDEFYSFLASADVVFTASWFEVTSLIEIQVLNLGKKLVCSKYSYNEPNANMYMFDPLSSADASNALELALNNETLPRSNKINNKLILQCIKELG